MCSSGVLAFGRLYEIVNGFVVLLSRVVSGRRFLVTCCSLLPCKPLIEKSQYLGNVELNILQIKVLLAIFLHFEQVIKLQVKFKQSSSSTYWIMLVFGHKIGRARFLPL
jgi:hypothetical protein